jgi:hypothetical protein
MWKGTHHRYSLDRLLSKTFKSKTEAESAAEQLRIDIRGGKFVRPGEAKPITREMLTLRALFQLYRDREKQGASESALTAFDYSVALICRTPVPALSGDPVPFGDWLIGDVTTDAAKRSGTSARSQARSPQTGTLNASRPCSPGQRASAASWWTSPH